MTDKQLPELQRGKTVRQYYATTFGEAYDPDENGVYKEPEQVKIFVSHPNTHKFVTKRMHGLSDYLRKKTKYCPWCDKDYLGKSGKELSQDEVKGMIQALEECDLIIVGLPEGNVSHWIIAENRQAKTMRKRILIINFGNSKIKSGMVRSLHSGYIRVDKKIKKKKFYKAIVEAIKDNLSHPIKYKDFRAPKKKESIKLTSAEEPSVEKKSPKKKSSKKDLYEEFADDDDAIIL